MRPRRRSESDEELLLERQVLDLMDGRIPKDIEKGDSAFVRLRSPLPEDTVEDPN